ncbi:MAG: glycosyltransferase [Saprospiraceae bacterium]|nr:glycosyltransferase [Saprospiraceae bacterium]MDG1433030.1 glycosyltransferase [Saprospiraceae bacterium]MDG2418056.1 glycosyltransferase [Saprospiraceae bacterium]
MRKDIDIIYFSLFPWDHPYSSVSFSISKEFIKNNRVFYINPPYSYRDFATRYGEKITQERMSDLIMHRLRYEHPPQLKNTLYKDNFLAALPPMVPPVNFLGKGEIYNLVRTRNNRIVLNTIKKVIKDNNIKDYIFMNCYNPFYAGFLPKNEFNPLLNIYQCIDDISQNAYTAKHGFDLERNAVQNSDVTIVTSQELKNIWRKDANEIHIVHNAADINIFEKTLTEKFERPEEIKNINTKIIGFVGNLDDLRVNYPLMKKIAEVHFDKTLLLVGPINNNQVYDLGMDKMPNIIFTGSKDIQNLPPYLQYIDVAIIPFLLNTLTKSIYPLKINEYLAAGRAVIATNFSEDIRAFKDVIHIAKSEDQFVNLIDKAIIEQIPEKIQKCMDVANSNTWGARVEQIWKIVEKKI